MHGNHFSGLCAAALFGALSAASSAAGQVQFVYDTFTASSNQTLESHVPDTGGAWSRQVGASGLTVVAATDRVTTNGSDKNIYFNSAVPGREEYVVGITTTFSNKSDGNLVEVWGRASVTLNGYVGEVSVKGKVTLWRVAGGTRTSLATGTASVSKDVPFTIILSLRNSSKEVWVDGNLIVSSTDNTIASAGLAGLGLQSNTAGSGASDTFFASTITPTAARIFDATAAQHDGRTLIEWRTADERENAGYRVYRAVGPDAESRPVVGGMESDPGPPRRRAHAWSRNGGFERVTPSLIPGSAFTAGVTELRAGNGYRWIDDGIASAYWIEEVDLSGRSSWHGPIVPQVQAFDPVAAPPRPLALRSHLRAAPAAATLSVGSRSPAGLDASEAAQPTQWAIAAGAAIKIGVRSAGWFRLPCSMLFEAGLPPSVDPRTLRLFRDGSEVPVTVEGEESARCDAVRFHGTPLSTASTDTRIYWLTWGGARGMRVPLVRSASGGKTGSEWFLARVVREEKVYYIAAVPNGDEESFFGPLVSTTSAEPTLQSLDAPGLVPGDGRATLEIVLRGMAVGDPMAGHEVAVSINGRDLPPLVFRGTEEASRRFAIPAEWLRREENVVSLSTPNGDADLSVVVSVALEYPHGFEADGGDQLTFTATGGQRLRLTGFPSDARVLDVTDVLQPFEVIPSGGPEGMIELTASGRGLRTMIAASAYLAPHSVVANEPSSLHAADADWIAITHPAFTSSISPLAAVRRDQGRKVLVATTTDIYDEFGFGAPGPDAIRAFLGHVHGRARRGGAVLLVGDATFDPRNYLGTADENFVPAKLIGTSTIQTASDSWMTDFDGDGTSEMAIGRLPVRTPAESAAVIRRIAGYDTETAGAWASRAVFVSDDDSSLEFARLSSEASRAVPPGISKIAIDVGTSGTAPARAELLQELEAGALLVDYVGHGSIGIWSSHGLFTSQDARMLANGSAAPVVLSRTCLNAFFHDPFGESVAEGFIRAGAGGAVAVWASSSLTAPGLQTAAHQAFLETLFQKGATLGDALIAGQKSANAPDVRKTFLLFGDPATRLKGRE